MRKKTVKKWSRSQVNKTAALSVFKALNDAANLDEEDLPFAQSDYK